MIMIKPSRMKHYDEASIIVDASKCTWLNTFGDNLWYRGDSSKLSPYLSGLLKYVKWALIVIMYYKPHQSTTIV